MRFFRDHRLSLIMFHLLLNVTCGLFVDTSLKFTLELPIEALNNPNQKKGRDMPTATLKETLLFGEDAGAASHRYEIYKSDSRGGFFAMIYALKPLRMEHNVFLAWSIEDSCLALRASYIPNARMECEAHWKDTFALAEGKTLRAV